MKKIMVVFLSFFLFINAYALEINSRNAILYNMNDGIIIYEKNSNEKIQVASLTKIVTAITIIETIDDLSEEVIITYDMIENLDGYAKIGLKTGDKVTYLDLLYALMLPSAADAAQALAISKSGSIEAFSELMNSKIEQIGATNSNFDNPIGIDSENNYSTASDLAKILIYSLENDLFKQIFNSNSYIIKNLNKEVRKTISSYSTNLSMINGAKTGFTYGAGLCLASTTTLEGINYLLITLGAEIKNEYHAKDAVKIYEYYSTNYGYVNILTKNQLLKTINVKNSKTKNYNIYSQDDISLYLQKAITKDNLEYKYEGIEELNKNIKKGDKLGTITILEDDNILYTYDVFLESEIEYYNYILYIMIIIGIMIIFILILMVIQRKKCNISKD